MRWRPYVPVRQRRANGLAQAKRAIGKGKTLKPVRVEGRKIAKTFWGSSWCTHLEKYSDFSNRLPRGRTYARNGSIVHLEISAGKITAMVAGSDLYHIKIKIDKMSAKAWQRLCEQCASSVTSTIDLLRGKLPEPVLNTLTDPNNDLFPQNSEIHLRCDCPDWADLCKHLAAVLYGVGNRLDDAPELLFLLRGVDQNDLIGSSLVEDIDQGGSLSGAESLDAGSGLEDIFGIDLIDAPEPAKPSKSKPKPSSKTAKKKTTKKKAGKKKTVKKKTVKKKTAQKKTAASSAKKKATRKKSQSKKSPAAKTAKKKAAKKKTTSRQTTKNKPQPKKTKTRRKKNS